MLQQASVHSAAVHVVYDTASALALLAAVHCRAVIPLQRCSTVKQHPCALQGSMIAGRPNSSLGTTVDRRYMRLSTSCTIRVVKGLLCLR